MLENILERVGRSNRVDEIRIIWPEDAPDRDENDLIGRHYDVAKEMRADFIVRVPGDNPCVEAEEIDRALSLRFSIGGTPCLVSNAGDYRFSEYPDGIGCEIYDITQLEVMDNVIKDPYLREHPHKTWHRAGQVIEPLCPEEFRGSRLRLDVNTQSDYESVKSVFDHFGHNQFHITEVIEFLASLEKRNIPT